LILSARGSFERGRDPAKHCSSSRPSISDAIGSFAERFQEFTLLAASLCDSTRGRTAAVENLNLDSLLNVFIRQGLDEITDRLNPEAVRETVQWLVRESAARDWRGTYLERFFDYAADDAAITPAST
jgi:hypothetical protein